MEQVKKTITEPQREIPVRKEVDVLVVGGGPSGIMAARAAAEAGQKTLLLESRGFLGGNLTIGIPILAFLDRKGKQIIYGLPQKFIDRMKAKGAALEHTPCAVHVSYTIFDPELVKTEAVDFVQEEGVEILMYVFCCGVVKEGNTVKGVIIESKAGREAILAKTVIDCTGDGDVAALAGVEMHKGDEKGGMQPPTLMYRMKGVDVQALRVALSQHSDVFDMDTMPPVQFTREKFITVGLRHQIKEAEEQGYQIPVARTILITGVGADEIWVNMTRVNGTDSTDPASYTRGEIIARKQMYEIARYLKNFVPGFKHAWIDIVAPFMGIRESRVMVGKYILRADDVIKCHRFDDVIGVASYAVDLHHPDDNDCTMIWCPENYDLPYRILVPEKIEGLLVAGRCCSVDHEALASTRVMSTCMCLGEASGRAAAEANKEGVPVSQVDVKKLQKILVETGAYLGEGRKFQS